MKSDVLNALDEATKTFLEASMQDLPDVPAPWKVAIGAIVTESFRSGYKAGLSYVEKEANDE